MKVPLRKSEGGFPPLRDMGSGRPTEATYLTVKPFSSEPLESGEVTLFPKDTSIELSFVSRLKNPSEARLGRDKKGGAKGGKDG